MQQQLLNNRYLLDHAVGEGGMATVYVANDQRLQRRVAIKILHSHYRDDPEFLSRFQHEAQAAAILNHPNVVRVYDVGQDGNSYYIVMEYVEGMNLKTLINRQAPLSAAQAIAIAEAVAHGLEAAHHVGFIHRDIKPQNIMVTPDNHVRITDFGIAKSHLSTATTQTGVSFGTADYISPEQAQGKHATPQSDIYSLGVTLFEMLTGQLPFKGDNPISVATQHVSASPPIPTHLNPSIPPALEALVLQAMAKEPQQRPSSAAEFAHLLHNYRLRADQQTLVSASAAQPTPHPHYVPPLPSTSRGDSGRLPTMPAPRPVVSRVPQSQGIGCGMFFIGMLILAGVVGLVLLLSSGTFDGLLASDSNKPERTPIVTPTALQPSPTPTPLPTATVTPIPVPLVTVPRLIGLGRNEAQQELLRVNLLPVEGGTRYSDTVPSGSVIEQLVPAMTEIAEGQPVTYVVSLGRETPLIEMPSFISRRLESARQEAETLGLYVEAVEEPSTTVSDGFVIRQVPAAGMVLEQGDTVQLVVSVGDKVWMPNLMGKSEAEANAIIETTDGLYLSYRDFQGYDKLGDTYFQVAPGTVISTIPDKDKWVNRGTGVTLGIRAYDTPPESTNSNNNGTP